MSSLKTFIKRKRVLAVILLGVSYIIIGIALWLITDLTIQNHEQILSNSNLIQEEKLRWENSLQWWRTAKTTIWEPASISLITIGICSIEYTMLYAALQPKRRTETSQTLLTQFW